MAKQVFLHSCCQRIARLVSLYERELAVGVQGQGRYDALPTLPDVLHSALSSLECHGRHMKANEIDKHSTIDISGTQQRLAGREGRQSMGGHGQQTTDRSELVISRVARR